MSTNPCLPYMALASIHEYIHLWRASNITTEVHDQTTEVRRSILCMRNGRPAPIIQTVSCPSCTAHITPQNSSVLCIITKYDRTSLRAQVSSPTFHTYKWVDTSVYQATTYPALKKRGLQALLLLITGTV